MRKRKGMLSILLGMAWSLVLINPESGYALTTIVWDSTTQKFLSAGTYGRIKVLADKSLVVVYSRGGIVCLRKSLQLNTAWGAEILVARNTGYGNTNAELIQLSNGWLLFGWNGRPTAGGPYFIATKISRDEGLTWGDEVRVYSAGLDFGTGCWEPAFLQLSSGEVQVYFANEGPYSGANADQEIGMKRSLDNGQTWGDYLSISHREGARDGMPVPLSLNGTLVVAIEDNGIEGSFKPVTVRTEQGKGWSSVPVLGKDPRRMHALAQGSRLPPGIYAGAPYLAKFPGGLTLLSIQTTQGRPVVVNPTDNAIMQVYLGDDSAQNFKGATVPFTGIPANGNALWNSLTVMDDSTVLAVSSIRGLGKDGLWSVVGRLRSDQTTDIFIAKQKGIQGFSAARNHNLKGQWKKHPQAHLEF
jgi:hypothetical protein